MIVESEVEPDIDHSEMEHLSSAAFFHTLGYYSSSSSLAVSA